MMIEAAGVAPAEVPITVRAGGRVEIQMIATATGSRLRPRRNTMASVLAADRAEIAPDLHAPIVIRVYSSPPLLIVVDVMTVAAVLEDRHAEIDALEFTLRNPRFAGDFSFSKDEKNARRQPRNRLSAHVATYSPSGA